MDENSHTSEVCVANGVVSNKTNCGADSGCCPAKSLTEIGNLDDSEAARLNTEEHDAFAKIVNSFLYYRAHSLKALRRSFVMYRKLPKDHQQLISHYPGHLNNLKLCVLHNYEVIKLILDGVGNIFENVCHDEVGSPADDEEPDIAVAGTFHHDKFIRPASEFNMDKLHSTLKQFARDWSEDGREERKNCYERLVNEVLLRHPDIESRGKVKILVPGAGLGRLAFDFAQLGFDSQGNEFSYFMLIASNFVLNRCKQTFQYSLYPWIHQTTNNMKNEDQLRPIKFPDVNPSVLPDGSNFSMIAGEFIEVYGPMTDEFSAVATSFFIDTAHNIVEYIQILWRILKPGGVWVNFGPLLYHFAGVANEDSIELCYADVRDVIVKTGFNIVKDETGCKATYIHNSRSMLTYTYDCVFFVAEKPAVLV